MQGSQDKLRQVLEGKLFDHEAAVSRESRNTVLTRIRAARRGALLRKILYSTAVIVMIASVTYYTQIDNTNAPLMMATAVSQITDQKDLALSTEVTDQPRQQQTATSASSGANGKASASVVFLNAGSSDKSIPAGLAGVVASSDQSTNVGRQDPPLSNEPDLTVVAPPQERSFNEIVASSTEIKEVAHMNPDEIQIASDEQKGKRKIRMSIGIMPTLNYKRIVPNSSDMAYIYHFQTPSSFDASRLGVTTTALVHFAMNKGRTLYAGAGFFNYQSQFSYSSSESSSNLSSSNEVNETLQGISIVAGGTLPLRIKDRRYINLNLGGQLQMPKAGTQFVLQAGIEYGLRMNERNTLIIQPIFFHAITALHYTGLLAYPFGAGIDFRYQFTIGKN
jgi:hypothetical protein